ncbi:MAG: 6-bladed beta-propeller [SAR202 cluster bacterium]|nr:6-bladed beta-propeller [SAR202 cluster bacterium]
MPKAKVAPRQEVAGLLRVGTPYERTVGMRRLTNTATDIALSKDGHLHILCRGENLVFVRRLTLDDKDLGAFNLVGGGGPVGGSFKVEADFVWPSAIAIDASDRLWVCDEGANKFFILTLDGKVKGSFGKQGTGPGEMNRPSGFCFSPNGNIYVADTLNHRVQEITREGKFLLEWGRPGSGAGEFNMPWGVAADPNGDVYVSDWRNDRIQKFTADGKFIKQIGGSGTGEGEFNRPAGVTVDQDGDLYVADWANHRVQLFDRGGRFVEKFAGDATLSRQAREYMISNVMAMRLREMTPIEQQKRFRWPTSVRTGPDGRVYVADYGSHRVQVYKKEAVRLAPGQIAPRPRSNTLYTQF